MHTLLLLGLGLKCGGLV